MAQDDGAELVERGEESILPDSGVLRNDDSSTERPNGGRVVVRARRRRGRRLALVGLLLVIAGGLVSGMLTGFVPFASVGDALGPVSQVPRSIADLLPGSASSAQTGADDCVRCHQSQSAGAVLTVAVNGAIVTGGQPVSARTGDTLNLAFHFTNVLGDPKRFQSVGVEITVPDKPLWRVIPGARQRPQEWSVMGSGAAFWSPAWENGGNADGPQYLQWASSKETPGRFYLTLQGVPFAVSDVAAHGGVLADRGADDPSDRDGVANHAGLTAMIVVPPSTTPGSYSFAIYGVGHGKDGKRSNVSKTIEVQVGAGDGQPARAPRQSNVAPGSAFVPAAPSGGTTASASSGAPSATGATPTPVPVLGTNLYKQYCANCHGRVQKELLSKSVDEAKLITIEGTQKVGGRMPPQGKSAGGKLSDDEIDRVFDFIRVTLRYPGGSTRKIQHGLEGREGKCDLCHGPDGVYPKPGGHTPDTGACTLCHQFPPKIPHSTVGREVCSACHTVPAKRQP
ncbi:MAG: cytochrome c [Chloroflexota bacterium]|nr:MAG: cytochrome c [Chloroflexota bacterium]